MDPIAEEGDALHPIVKLAWRVLDAADVPRPDRLSAALADLAGTPDLRPAVLSLVTIAQYLDELGRPDAADILLEACASVIEALKMDGTASDLKDQDRRRLKSETFARFQGQAPSPKAPRFGEPGKTGTITAASLMTPKRRFA